MKPYIPEEMLRAERPKDQIIFALKAMFRGLGLSIVDDMSDKPWGAGYRFDDGNLDIFLEAFYPGEPVDVQEGMTMSPKILLIAPNKRLSWQYHHRRAELWKVFAGPVGTIRSDTDQQPSLVTHHAGELIRCAREQRHRIVGLENWAIIAEIWDHADPIHPSDEEDIVRRSDDYGREGTHTK